MITCAYILISHQRFQPWMPAVAISGTQPKSQSWHDRSELGLQLSWKQGSVAGASLLLSEEEEEKIRTTNQKWWSKSSSQTYFLKWQGIWADRFLQRIYITNRQEHEMTTSIAIWRGQSNYNKSWMWVHTCNPSTQGADKEGERILGQSGLLFPKLQQLSLHRFAKDILSSHPHRITSISGISFWMALLLNLGRPATNSQVILANQYILVLTKDRTRW